jgi:hypothetical protein
LIIAPVFSCNNPIWRFNPLGATSKLHSARIIKQLLQDSAQHSDGPNAIKAAQTLYKKTGRLSIQDSIKMLQVVAAMAYVIGSGSAITLSFHTANMVMSIWADSNPI